MKAIILAAGRGSRLGALTQDQPKGLVKLCGHALVEHMIASMNAAGITDIALVTGYRRDAYDYLGYPTFFNPRWDKTNMVMSLAQARRWLGSEPVIISYSDIVVSPDHISRLMQSKGDLTMTYDSEWLSLWKDRFEDVLSDAESFRIENDRLVEIGQKAACEEDIQGQYMGLFKTTPTSWGWFEDLISNTDQKQMAHLSVTEIFQMFLTGGKNIETLCVKGQWGEVDDQHDLAVMQKYVETGQLGHWFNAGM